MNPALARQLDFLLVGIGLLAIWQGLFLWIGETGISSPLQTFRHLGALAERQMFWKHAWATLDAFLRSLAIAALGGIAIGLWLGIGKVAGQVAEPILVALYSLPKVTLYPVILLIFGLGLSAKVAFGAIHGIIPVILFTMSSVRTIRPVLIKTAKVMRLSPGATAWRVLMPAALPEIVTGLRIGFSLTLLGVLIGEMFASQAGLGFMVINAIGLNDTETMMAVTVLMIVLAGTANLALLALDHRLHRRAAP